MLRNAAKKLRSTSLITLGLVNFSVYAFDIDNGKALHDENCLRCHDASIYKKETRKIMHYQALHDRVRQCALMTEAAWFDEEIDDVAAYLNSAFYHFDLEK